MYFYNVIGFENTALFEVVINIELHASPDVDFPKLQNKLNTNVLHLEGLKRYLPQ